MNNYLEQETSPALDFSPGGIKLDHLFCCKRNGGGDQRESKTFVIYENNFDLTSERLGHAEQLDFPIFAVNIGGKIRSVNVDVWKACRMMSVRLIF